MRKEMIRIYVSLDISTDVPVVRGILIFFQDKKYLC
ncbi:MAG: hypothetical protein IEMM0006_1951 [bacterium]|nr:MAG: hypothetical protein IEMM0006_1951 [bacterium]